MMMLDDEAGHDIAARDLSSAEMSKKSLIALFSRSLIITPYAPKLVVIDAEASIPASIQARIKRLGCGRNFSPLFTESPMNKM
ncbi:hypothetical protein [Lactobacillus delbrueckii]|uniref:hypothetical protein n=1 Tax=Lactobacillus delbrueckii TaxID=1584 RepID=UPI001F15093A|nr:hypothetical protein [Lactobacillus delbrueckii]